MSDQNALPYVLFRLKMLPHTSGNVHKQRTKLFALPVHLLRQVTGSAGTAMDVLVTCFSKMGGGSGRRGCKNRAQVGVRCAARIPRKIFLSLVSHFLQMSLKHSACHTFRASGHLRRGPFGDSFSNFFNVF